MEIQIINQNKSINILDIIEMKESEIDEDLVCSICANIMIDPTSSSFCRSHLFCKHCYLEWLEKSSTCPICRLEVPRNEYGNQELDTILNEIETSGDLSSSSSSSLSLPSSIELINDIKRVKESKELLYSLVLNQKVNDKINSIKVYCPYSFKINCIPSGSNSLDSGNASSNGLKSSGNNNINNNNNNNYQLVTGEFDNENGCKEIITVGQFNQHIKECVYSFKKCEYSIKSSKDRCGVLRLFQLNDHYANLCPYVILVCEYCNKKYKRGNTELHFSKCLLYQVDCEFGCTEKILRSKLDEHYQVCPNKLYDCPFKDSGCNDQFKNGGEMKHLELYNGHQIYLFKKIEMLSLQVVKQNNDILALNEKIQDQNNQMLKLKSMVVYSKYTFIFSSIQDQQPITKNNIEMFISSIPFEFNSELKHYTINFNIFNLNKYKKFNLNITIDNQVILDVNDQILLLKFNSYPLDIILGDNYYRLKNKPIIATIQLEKRIE